MITSSLCQKNIKAIDVGSLEHPCLGVVEATIDAMMQMQLSNSKNLLAQAQYRYYGSKKKSKTWPGHVSASIFNYFTVIGLLSLKSAKWSHVHQKVEIS